MNLIKLNSLTDYVHIIRGEIIMLKKLSIIFVVYMMIVSGSFSKVNADSYGQYEYTVTNNEATITDYKGREKDIKIPSEINGYKVTDYSQGTAPSIA